MPLEPLSAALPRSRVVGKAGVALLERLIDHAPLFPPASLPLAEAVAEDVRARDGAYAFALGRFVCPASLLPSLPDVGRGLTVVLDGRLVPDSRVEAVEAPPGTELSTLDGLASEVYVEVPLDDTLDSRLAEIAAHGFRAKARCTGEPVRLEWFLLECRTQRLQYKLTGGLHHAVRTKREHGLLNVLAAAVFGDEEILDEEDPDAFALSPTGFRCRERVARADEVARGRRASLHSVGSCSFFEPIEELEELGILPL
jgi:hypothetical protein